MSETLDLESRFRRIERRARRAEACAVACLVALGAVVLGAMQSASPRELSVERVTARQFSVVDESGRVRGSLGVNGRWGADESAVALTLHGPLPDSNTRVEIRAGMTVAEVQARDSWSNTLASLEAGKERAQVTVGSAPKGAKGVTMLSAVLAAADGTGRIELTENQLDAELSKDGATAWGEEARLEITPTDGVVKRR